MLCDFPSRFLLPCYFWVSSDFQIIKPNLSQRLRTNMNIRAVFKIQGSKVKPGDFTPPTGGISAAEGTGQHGLLPAFPEQKASARSRGEERLLEAWPGRAAGSANAMVGFRCNLRRGHCQLGSQPRAAWQGGFAGTYGVPAPEYLSASPSLLGQRPRAHLQSHQNNHIG